MSSNPYAAPKAAVADAIIPVQGNFVPGGRSVPAGHGWLWIVEAWNIFKRQPWMWIGMLIITFLIIVAIALIPLLGSFLLSLAWPIYTAGFAYCSREAEEGREIELAHLFVGFRERLGTLLAVGAIYLLASFAVMLVVALFMGVSVFIFFGGTPDSSMAPLTVVLVALIALALMLPLAMTIWFAPALVLFQNYGATQAMRESFFACLKNILPFLVYGVVGLALFIVAAIPLLLGWFVFFPVMAASVYTCYRDVFHST